jgi:hypothetical protein
MIVQRDLREIIKRFLKRREYLAIVGPRQAGKTTFLEIIKDYLIHKLKVEPSLIQILTFEDRRLLAEFEADPIAFIHSYLPSDTSNTFYLMLDEFQYAEAGGQRLKLIYDTIKGVKIIITGSSSLDIKAQVGRFLVGRILTFYLFPFNFGEYLRVKDLRMSKIYQNKNKEVIAWLFENKPFVLKRGKDVFAQEMLKLYENFCIWGGYPSVILSKSIEEQRKVLNDIYNNYILKDIKGLLELATDKNLLLLSQYLATQIGNVVIYQNLSEVSGLNYRKLQTHLNILKETFILSEVRPFFKNRNKELSKNPKIFFLDLGFRNNLMENMTSLDKRPDTGAMIENAVFIRLNELSEAADKINFYRTKAGAEVDFILHKGSDILPIEVKFSNFEQESVSRSLMNFIESFNPKSAVVLTKDFWGRINKNNTEIMFIPVYYL